MATYGITISKPQLLLIVFTNIEGAMQHDYSREFRPAMAAIHKLFKYDYIHSATSLEAIISKLGNVDGVRTMKDAPSSSNPRIGTANAVDDSVSRMQQLTQNCSDSEIGSSDYKSAYSATF